MSDLNRRMFLAGAAGVAGAVGLLAPKTVEAGDPSFMNNVPDPLLSEKELPTFKFALEKSKGKVIGKSYGKEATVEQLPISKGMAGVSMLIEPGAMRELHWHATAAEWAFVDKGRVRTTVLSPGGYRETNDFEPGDVWYFPRGHGHMLECLGDEPCHFILPRTGTGRTSGTALAPDGRRVAVRLRGRGQHRGVRRQRSLQEREVRAGRRRLCPAGVRTLAGKPRRQAVPCSHWLQQRDLRGHRLDGVDGRQPARRARHQLQQAGVAVREVSAQGRVHHIR